ncbi:hypothetical protein LO772_33540 [Yinghuangia sp. ASG 101]|uniref:hypothetical protein n=1 Tax=Yinghuangia sp. ASG 101 TaxID=2896848 RepID=UPI001E4FE9FF|nr:hypothetical protein [Yinghuangia sp. ASG 101]UGQ11643.1 hypothetical protein LO772_33540 [Yinghuangia sp. ASG 101]
MPKEGEAAWESRINDASFRASLLRAAIAVQASGHNDLNRQQIRESSQDLVSTMIRIHKEYPRDSLVSALAREAITKLADLGAHGATMGRVNDADRKVVLDNARRARAKTIDGTPSLASSFFRSSLGLLDDGSSGRAELLSRLWLGAAVAGPLFAPGSATRDGYVRNVAEIVGREPKFRRQPGWGVSEENTRQHLRELGVATAYMLAGLTPDRLSHREFAAAATNTFDQIKSTLEMAERPHPQTFAALEFFGNAAHWAEAGHFPYDSIMEAVRSEVGEQNVQPTLAALLAARGKPISVAANPAVTRVPRSLDEAHDALRQRYGQPATAPEADTLWFLLKENEAHRFDHVPGIARYAGALASAFLTVADRKKRFDALPEAVEAAVFQLKGALFQRWQGLQGEVGHAGDSGQPSPFPMMEPAVTPVFDNREDRIRAAHTLFQARQYVENTLGMRDPEGERLALVRIDEAERATQLISGWAHYFRDPEVSRKATAARHILTGFADDAGGISRLTLEEIDYLDAYVQPALLMARRAENLKTIRRDLGLDRGMTEAAAEHAAAATVAALSLRGSEMPIARQRALAGLDSLPASASAREQAAWEVTWQTLVARGKDAETGQPVPLFPTRGVPFETLADLVEHKADKTQGLRVATVLARSIGPINRGSGRGGLALPVNRSPELGTVTTKNVSTSEVNQPTLPVHPEAPAAARLGAGRGLGIERWT